MSNEFLVGHTHPHRVQWNEARSERPESRPEQSCSGKSLGRESATAGSAEHEFSRSSTERSESGLSQVVRNAIMKCTGGKRG
jgi:hypothetical protein